MRFCHLHLGADRARGPGAAFGAPSATGETPIRDGPSCCVGEGGAGPDSVWGIVGRSRRCQFKAGRAVRRGCARRRAI
eukprot:6006079-Lingulodinium_polyedra.AAC.1